MTEESSTKPAGEKPAAGLKGKRQKKKEARQFKKAERQEARRARKAARSEARRVWIASLHPKAYSGDSYVSDLAKASKSGKPWMTFVLFGVFITVLADFSMLSSVFSYLFDTGSSGLVNFLLNYFVPLATILGYLFIGFFAGKKLREFMVLRRGTALVSSILFMLIEIAILLLIAIVRYYSELAIAGAGTQNAFSGGFGGGAGGFSGGFGGQGFGSSEQGFFDTLGLTFDADALWCALMLSFVMVIGALLEIYYSYCTYDPFAAEKKILAEAHIAEDRLLYEKVYFEVTSSSEKNSAYEERERELDRRTVDVAFRISSLAMQLNGIVDPADAYDFCTVSRLINEDYFKN